MGAGVTDWGYLFSPGVSKNVAFDNSEFAPPKEHTSNGGNNYRIANADAVTKEKAHNTNAFVCKTKTATIDQLKVQQPLRYKKVDDCQRILDYAHMAANVYLPEANDAIAKEYGKLTGGWKVSELNQTLGIQLKLVDKKIGFSSRIYERAKNGIVEYAYVMRGTSCDNTYDCIIDWLNNLWQSTTGIAPQYELALDNAIILDKYMKKLHSKLIFIGHSLGGGLASLAALKTSRIGVTFNAAGLNPNLEINKRILPYFTRGNIKSYIVKGEIVDYLQPRLLKAEPERIYLEPAYQPTLVEELFLHKYLTSYRVRLHLMDSVIETLKKACEKGQLFLYEPDK